MRINVRLLSLCSLPACYSLFLSLSLIVSLTSSSSLNMCELLIGECDLSVLREGQRVECADFRLLLVSPSLLKKSL